MLNHNMSHRQKRLRRTRNKLAAVSTNPRLSVLRSEKHIYGQIIDGGRTLASANDLEIKKAKLTKTEIAAEVGRILAEKALKSKIKQVVFDRGSYAYHGRVKSLADAARSAGLQF